MPSLRQSREHNAGRRQQRHSRECPDEPCPYGQTHSLPACISSSEVEL